MFVVEVVPLSRKMPFDTLLYTSRESHQIGDLVAVPFQDSSISAVVVRIHDLMAVKSHIRALPYRIKDGVDEVQQQWIPHSICTKLLTFAAAHTIPLSSVFQLFWHEGAPIFDGTLAENSTQPVGVVGSMAERVSAYLMNEVSNMIIVCPSSEHARALAEHVTGVQAIITKPQLQKYLNRHVIPTKEGYRSSKVDTNLPQQDPSMPRDDGNVSIVVIPNILLSGILPTLPRATTIIFDGVMSDQFQRRTKTGEFFHHAAIYISLASWMGHNVIVGDELLPFGDWGTLWSHDREYIVTAPAIASEAMQTKHKKKRTLESYHLSQLADHAIKGKRVMIFCNQRDLYGYVSCPKCHYVERCETCNSIVRLVTEGSRHMLECATCHTRSRARDICRSCGGITLETRRQGIEGYAQKIAEISPLIPVCILSKETKKPAVMLRSWHESGGILITTSIVFSNPELSADTIYVAPHTWTAAPDTPEEHLYEYLWLHHRARTLITLPIAKELLTQSQNSDTLDITARARNEFESAQAHGVQLPSILI